MSKPKKKGASRPKKSASKKPARSKRARSPKEAEAKATAEGHIPEPAGRRGKAARKAIEEAVKSGAIDSDKAAQRIVKRYTAWQQATGDLHDASKRAAERIKSEKGSFVAAIEMGVPNDDIEAKAKKLGDVTQHWAGWQDAISTGANERKVAKEKRSKAAKALDRAVEETRQLSLPGTDEDD